jgi:hypothetical protein
VDRAGRRVTAAPTFMPMRRPRWRALYRRHPAATRSCATSATAASRTDAGGACRDGPLGLVVDALDFDSDGWDDLYIANGMLTRAE